MVTLLAKSPEFSSVNDQVVQHLPGPVYLFLLNPVSFRSVAVVSNLIESRSISLFILHLPDTRPGRSPSFVFLLNHQLNRFIAHTGFLQVRNLLSRQTLAPLERDCKDHKNQNGSRGSKFCQPEAQILLDKTPN